MTFYDSVSSQSYGDALANENVFVPPLSERGEGVGTIEGVKPCLRLDVLTVLRKTFPALAHANDEKEN